VPQPPVVSVEQLLPFGALTWENFERLCYRLAKSGGGVQDVHRYGRQGQAQGGIDIFVRAAGPVYHVWQVKRVARFTAASLRAALKLFRQGQWFERSASLTIALQVSTADTALQDAIEAEVRSLAQEGINLSVLGAEELSEQLRALPEIVDDFFGRAWSEAFLGPTTAARLNARLDGHEWARVREQLERVYRTQFAILDRGISVALASAEGDAVELPLQERYVEQDVLRRAAGSAGERPILQQSGQSTTSEADGRDTASARPLASQIVRQPCAAWLTQGERLALLADAGLGKSTFLRMLALDLLGPPSVFEAAATKWVGRLPVVLPFARWARATARSDGQVGLKAVVASVWQPVLTADLISLLDRAIDEGRILLLVDGLDEWAEEQAARTALMTLLTTAGAHQIPVVATGRPRGVQQLGGLPADWSLAELAPLSIPQQRQLAGRWFEQALRSTAAEPAQSVVDAEVSRFFWNLAQQPGLSELAETPLLLLGLVGLAIRRLALPSSRAEALGRLVETLLDEHPQRRATAAGEPRPRFEALADTGVRRNVLRQLAFASRREGAEAGFSAGRAETIVVDFLEREEGFTRAQARAAASELLSVNAETVGLLIEKSPGEVGFAHASFEEFLSAEAIQRWPHADALEFAAGHAANPRWRNTLNDLACIIPRPNEARDLLAAIRNAPIAGRASFYRDQLLAGIALAAPALPHADALPVVEELAAVIETATWPEHRRTLLRAFATSSVRPALTPALNRHLSRWAPARVRYARTTFEALGQLAPAADARAALIRGLSAERVEDRFSAAEVLGARYVGDSESAELLERLIRTDSEYETSAAALHALAMAAGPAPSRWEGLLKFARQSSAPLLRAVAIAATVRNGTRDSADKNELLGWLGDKFRQDPGIPDLAQRAIFEGWPNDDEIFSAALRELTQAGYKRELDPDFARTYVLGCPASRTETLEWLRHDLERDHPTISFGSTDWLRLLPFAQADDVIRGRIVEVLSGPRGIILDNYAWRLVAQSGWPELRDLAIAKVRSDNGSMTGYWNLLPLLRGWRGDPVVEAFIEEVAAWPANRLENLASVLPEIIPDNAACRSRLLEITPRDGRLRWDLVARGLIGAGCDGADTQVVDHLLPAADASRPLFGPTAELIEGFAADGRVRALGWDCLSSSDAPIVQLLHSFGEDAEFRPRLLDFAASLSSAQRYELSQTARAEGGGRQWSRSLLAAYDNETVRDLAVILAAGHYDRVAQEGPTEGDLASLAEGARAIGPDHDRRRAAAFVGYAKLGRLDRFAEEVGDERPLNLLGIGGLDDSPAASQIVVEAWGKLSALCVNLPNRLGSFSGHEAEAWEELASSLAGEGPAAEAFLTYCDTTTSPLRENSLRALARLRRGAADVEDHCWRVLEPGHHGDLWTARARVVAAHILAEDFRGRVDIVERLSESVGDPRLPEAKVIALAIYAPNADALASYTLDEGDLARRFYDWPTVMHLAAARSTTDRFIELTLKMLHRPVVQVWDLQANINEVVRGRLATDPAAVDGLTALLVEAEPTTTVVASVPRLLAAAGLLDGKARELTLEFLDDELSRSGLPETGFDAIAERQRSVAHALLDALGQPS
jgi:hypothetical protein